MKASKILFFVNSYKPAKHSGGPIYSVSRMAESLAKHGYDVEVFTTRLFQETNCPDSLVIEGVKVNYIKFKPNLLARTGISYFNTSISVDLERSFWEQIKELLPHCSYAIIRNTYFPNARRLSRLLTRNAVPYAYYSAGELSFARVRFRFFKKIAYLYLFERHILNSADRLICFTEQEKSDYRWISNNRQFAVIPNGIDESGEIDARALSSSLCDTLNQHSDAHRFLFFGRIHPTKGPHIAISALSQLTSKYSNSILYIAGSQENPSYQKELNELIDSLGLSKRVVFLGCLSGADKLFVLRNCNTLLAPTSAEGFSISILESLNEGLPVVTTDGARFPEIESCNCGMIVDRDANSFANSMADMFDNSDQQRMEMSSAAKQLINDKYRWDKIVPLFISKLLD